MGVTQQRTADNTSGSTDSANEMSEIEASAVKQVSPEVEQKVRGNEPVLCPPYCYAGVVAGGFAKGYLATKSAGSSVQTDSVDASAARDEQELEDAAVNDLLQAREQLE